MSNFAEQKQNIKQMTEANQRRNAKRRAIESNDEREVHFLFNSGNKAPVTPFTKKFDKFLDGSLAEFETEEAKNFEEYIERYKEENLNEGEENPV